MDGVASSSNCCFQRLLVEIRIIDVYDGFGLFEIDIYLRNPCYCR